ncbi:MAG TPA: dTMP kinase [Nitrospira sp.]|nr:dTMP kinase [Nitrospira sp.]
MPMRAGKRKHDGLFITFEGPEGSGKTTQIRRLRQVLIRAGYSVLHTREPGGTKVAEAIRGVLLSPLTEPMTAEAEALLILAARCQHVRHVIRPALGRGEIVLCDRFSDSTFAYQGFGRGLNMTWLETANRVATADLSPDLTLLFDLPASAGLARRRSDRGEQNRLDRESVRFHDAVRRGFLSLAKRAPRRIRVIDASRSVQEVAAEVEAIVLRFASRCRRT